MIHLRGGVFHYLLLQFDNQFSDQFHFFQQQANNNEARIVSQFFNHQIGSVLFDGARVIGSTPDGRIELVGLI